MNGINVITGLLDTYYPDMDYFDPHPTQLQGMYFSGASYIQLSDMILPLSFTIECWINFESYGSILNIYNPNVSYRPDYYFSIGIDYNLLINFT